MHLNNKLHLHIGSPKTGTTSLQNFLFKNRNSLFKQGFKYPGNEVNHHKFFFATNSPYAKWPGQFKSYERTKLKTAVENYFSALELSFEKGGEHIISNEFLFIDDEESVTNLRRYLDQFFQEIEIYLYIRNPIDYYRSLQQQKIKSRSYVKSPYEFKYEFKNVIHTWRKHFDVNIIEYNKEVDSCRDFCNRVGLNRQQLVKPQKRVKTSASLEQMLLLEKIQKHVYKNYENRLKIHLKSLLHINPDFLTRPKLQEWVKPIIYEIHEEDIKWLNKRYKIDFRREINTNVVAKSPGNFKEGKGNVRDVYQVECEELVHKYESLCFDALLKAINKKN